MRTELTTARPLQTGWIHGLISTPLALYFILHPSPELVKDGVYGYSAREGVMFAVSGGYFLYDWLVSVYYVRTHGLPFVLHATACCFIFLKASLPSLPFPCVGLVLFAWRWIRAMPS